MGCRPAWFECSKSFSSPGTRSAHAQAKELSVIASNTVRPSFWPLLTKKSVQENLSCLKWTLPWLIQTGRAILPGNYITQQCSSWEAGKQSDGPQSKTSSPVQPGKLEHRWCSNWRPQMKNLSGLEAASPIAPEQRSSFIASLIAEYSHQTALPSNSAAYSGTWIACGFSYLQIKTVASPDQDV